MRRFWYSVYNFIALPLFWALLRFGALLNKKIARGIRGREGLFNRLQRDVDKLNSAPRIWFHSSSLGEFEQAKPIIAALRKRSSPMTIIVSFFSPSGYEHSKTYPLADLITYIPFDTASNARRFIELIKPDAAVMVRYDIWPNHLRELRRRNVPAFIANATLRPNSARFLWPFSGFHHQVYQDLKAILTVSESDAASFRRFGLTNPEIRVIGETRYDQVWQRSIEARKKHLIPTALLRKKKVFVAGSSWEEDEEILLPAFQDVARTDPSALMILVPHEPTLETLERLELDLFRLRLRSIRFSDLNDYDNEQVIIVDSIGILLALYQYAHVAYVGGSFKQGIHNVLEPAVFGCPVLYGPKHENSQEAIELARRGGGIVVHSRDECRLSLERFFQKDKERKRTGAIALALVKKNVGATKRFLDYISPVLKHQDDQP